MRIVRKSMLALLLAASVPMTSQAAGIVSTVTTVSDDIVVSSNAEAMVTATGRTDLISGSYPSKFQVGTWSASVTSGSVAFKFNSEVMSNIDASGLYGDAVNTSDATKKVRLNLNNSIGDCATTSQQNVSGSVWRACPQGVSVYNGPISLSEGVSLTPGSYRVGYDVASYAY
ncbi:hypothetical protein [Serratia marcescens]|uniref:hypothetical protein n=1 Tax=Serratia marcescens TaxID=615 RepID=UPI00111736A1|nr:hypothetical protein [Serratia marcescens]